MTYHKQTSTLASFHHLVDKLQFCEAAIDERTGLLWVKSGHWGTSPDEVGEDSVEIGFSIGTQHKDLHAQAGRRLLHILQLVFWRANSPC